MSRLPQSFQMYMIKTFTHNPIIMHRLLIAHTPLGNALWAVSVSGREALPAPYAFEVRFKSHDANLDCQAMLGERCAIELEVDRRGRRYLSGQMVRFSAIGRHGRHWVYAATVAPKLWHASRRADFRIWQNKTVPEILAQVLGENAVRFELRLKAPYKRWEYLTQHGETDLDFICRRLEHEGIFFWFEHGADGETMVLADHFTAHPVFPGYASVPYYDGTEARAEADHFDHWHLARQVETGRYTHTDYDFKRPAADLTTEHNDPRGHLFDQYARFAYPGNYLETANGKNYAADTLEGLQREQECLALAGRARGAAPGHRFTLRNHPRGELNREWVVTAATYEFADNDYEAGAGSDESRFRVALDTIPADRPWRAPLATPVPRTRGVQTAVVVGPPGEDIHTDEYGRIKVHFHWDRYGKKDGTDTCWIRVAQPWAGTNFGAIHLPRIGQEVIVDFEFGDPDRPIVTGPVYNAAQMPPWALPANKTQSGILTRSTKGGGPANANAIRFEDLAGAEQLWIHAERNQDIEVEQDETHWVGQDRAKTIDRDETSHIKRNRTETVGANESMAIGANRSKRVERNETDKIGRSWSVKVGRFKTETIGMAYMQSVGLGRMENVGLGYSLNVGMAMNTLVGMSQTAQIGQDKSTTVGRTYTLKAGAGSGGGSSITTDGDSITLKVGASVLVMKADGTVTLDGNDFTTTLTGEQAVKADGNITLKGAKILEN